MKKIINRIAVVTALVLLLISATPTGIAAGHNQKDYYIHPVNTKVDSTSVVVKDLLESSKLLRKL